MSGPASRRIIFVGTTQCTKPRTIVVTADVAVTEASLQLHAGNQMVPASRVSATPRVYRDGSYTFFTALRIALLRVSDKFSPDYEGQRLQVVHPEDCEVKFLESQLLITPHEPRTLEQALDFLRIARVDFATHAQYGLNPLATRYFGQRLMRAAQLVEETCPELP